jgi:hypothetical protein
LISISELNALAMWAHETVLNEQLVLSRLIAFAFSRSLDPERTSRCFGLGAKIKNFDEAFLGRKFLDF